MSLASVSQLWVPPATQVPQQTPAQAPTWADAEAAACALQAVAPVGVTLFRTEDLLVQ